MAVPTIPSAIALTDIQTEFGGSNPIAINEYYSGGTYVPSGTANATSVTIPTTGQIAFSNFSGAAAGYLPIVKAFDIYDQDFLSAVATVVWYGIGTKNWSPTSYTTCNVTTYEWATIGANSAYDLRVTKTAGTGTLTGVTNNAWKNMITNTTVQLSRSTVGISTVTATCSIKYNANSTVIDSNSCVWTVERKFGK